MTVSGGASNPVMGGGPPDEPGLSMKLFVGGIAPDSTKESLGNYFERFGEVREFHIMMDNATGNSRGFGFVTFMSEVLTVDNSSISAFCKTSILSFNSTL